MRSKRWVVNASPLILLGKLGRMDLLESLAASIAVPQSVIREIEAGAESDAGTGATVSWAKARGKNVPTKEAHRSSHANDALHFVQHILCRLVGELHGGKIKPKCKCRVG